MSPEERRKFQREDFNYLHSKLREAVADNDEVLLRARLSNNLNTILAALKIAGDEP